MAAVGAEVQLRVQSPMPTLTSRKLSAMPKQFEESSQEFRHMQSWLSSDATNHTKEAVSDACLMQLQIKAELELWYSKQGGLSDADWRVFSEALKVTKWITERCSKLSASFFAKEDQTVAEKKEGYGYKLAICADHTMKEGKHYAEFTLVEKHCDVCVGICKAPSKDAMEVDEETHLIECVKGDPTDTEDGWGIFTEQGGLCHDGNFAYMNYGEWAHGFYPGDKVGLLLDLDEGTLTVYKGESPSNTAKVKMGPGQQPGAKQPGQAAAPGGGAAAGGAPGPPGGPPGPRGPGGPPPPPPMPGGRGPPGPPPPPPPPGGRGPPGAPPPPPGGRGPPGPPPPPPPGGGRGPPGPPPPPPPGGRGGRGPPGPPPPPPPGGRGGGGGGPGPPGPPAAGGGGGGGDGGALKNKKKEMNLAKKEKPKPAGPMKKIGKAWPNEDDPNQTVPIAGEFCWMVQLCTVGCV